MNDLQIFKNEKLELQIRCILNEDGSISMNMEDTARGFGFTTIAKSGNTVVADTERSEIDGENHSS